MAKDFQLLACVVSLVPARIIVCMGVSGSGKSVVGSAVARRLHAPFLEGDDYHPAANKDKMRAGIPLTDADRWPWLDALAAALHETAGTKGVVVSACSALKRSYRDRLTERAGEPVLFVYLEGSRELLETRLAGRHHEFMPASLLDSQLATLEPPAADENAITVPDRESIEIVADRIVRQLGHLKVFKRKQ
jgi:carbohydrate kinase (thermoresistant glucokinase family)